MDYWNSILTEKSWAALQQLKREFKFIVIGGWAVWLWAKAHKSRDIDIIVDFIELEKLRQKFNVVKNERLKKYEIHIEEVDVDIYVPHYSRLAFPLEDAERHSSQIESLAVLKPEALMLLKQSAEIARSGSEKGSKDRIDMLDLLLKTGFDYGQYRELAEKYGLKDYPGHLKTTVKNFISYEFLGLNPRQFKLRKNEVLKKLQLQK